MRTKQSNRITHRYYRGAVGALLVYDITVRSTFDNIGVWLAELSHYSDNDMTIVLVSCNTTFAYNAGRKQVRPSQSASHRIARSRSIC